MSLVVQTVRAREGIEALRGPWEDLLARETHRSPFLSPDWFRCCLEVAEESTPLFLAAWEGDRLVGLAPFCVFTQKVRWRVARAVGFIRCRETPFADFVVEPSRRDEVLAAILAHLHSVERSSWDLLVLAPWPESSLNAGAVREWLRATGRKWTQGVVSVVPIVTMPEGWEAFMESRSYLFRKSRRGILNRMQKLGTAEVECHRADPDGGVLRTVYDVSERGWKHQEGKALTNREDSKRFFAVLTEAAGRRGWLLVWILKLNGRPIAMEYNLMEDGIAYALRADFDQEHRRSSPGAYLEYHIFERLFTEGCRAYQAGPGSDAYKLRWAENLGRNLGVTIYNGGLANQALWLAERWVLPGLRRVRDSWTKARPADQDLNEESNT